ncbi:PAS domain-containing protein [Candidatus Saccharibacteria bacterium]|nr:PAS domain-containing protein [Candidatus Saccharibacteria bacterium]
MFAISVIALYLVRQFNILPGSSTIVAINLPALILACFTAVVSLVFVIFANDKIALAVSALVFALASACIAVLIVTSGGFASPFIALWILISLFAAIFGVLGSTAVLILTCVFLSFNYISSGLTVQNWLAVGFCAVLPTIAGGLIWFGKQDQSVSDDKAKKHSKTQEIANKSDFIINAIGDGVMTVNNQGVIGLINPAAQNLLGWKQQDAVGLSYKSVLKLLNNKDESLDATIDPIQQTLNTNQQVRTNDLKAVTNSEKKVSLSLVVSPVGEVGSGAIAVFHDISREKAEEREKAEFISTASHEMRTPVASIEGYLGLAINPSTATVDSRARDFILKAHDSAKHLGHLFQDLLDISKAEDGRMSNNPSVIDIVPFIRDIVQGLRQQAVDKGIVLTYKPMSENPSIKFVAPAYAVNLDMDHIREIINNLVENAIKYTAAGSVTVDVNGDEEHVTISIQDTGIGIPAEDMPHLFQKFYRVDDKNTRDIGGTGLGLFLCRRLAEIMGGRIWAESTYGKGSTFFLELPRITNTEAVHLTTKEAVNNQTEAKKIADAAVKQIEAPPQPIAANLVLPPKQVIEPVLHSVPRGQALTPEQKAAYIAKQRVLAQQNATPQLSRPRTISVPERPPLR